MPANGDGASLMLNGHIDVVPIGDPVVWHDQLVEAARAEFEAAIDQACDDDPRLRDHPVEVEWWEVYGATCAVLRETPGKNLHDR